MEAVNIGNVGGKLRALREELKLSQTEFGAKIGTMQSMISDWEVGRNLINLDTLAKICQVFAVDWGYFRP